jgi:hypothetical protein
VKKGVNHGENSRLKDLSEKTQCPKAIGGISFKKS